MILPIYFDSKKSSNLYGFSQNFQFLKDIYVNNKLPKVLMLSGNKGSGKATLINHLMYFVFDKENYNEADNEFNSKSIYYNQFLNNIYTNIIYLSGADFKAIKIDDIRNLKKKYFKVQFLISHDL